MINGRHSPPLAFRSAVRYNVNKHSTGFSMRLTRPWQAFGLAALLLVTSAVHADPRGGSSYSGRSSSGGFRSPAPTYHAPPPAQTYRAPDTSGGFRTPYKPPDTGFGGFKAPPPAAFKPPSDTGSGGFKAPPSTGTTTFRGPTDRQQTQGGFVAPPTAPQNQQRQGGFAAPGSTASGPPAAAPPVNRSAADTAISRSQSAAALSQFRADQNKFKAPPAAPPPTQQAAQQSNAWRSYGANRWNTADDFYAARRRAEARLPPQINNYYQSPPVWVRNGPPSYGSWAAPFLGGLLLGGIGTKAYDSWAYSHWNDPGVTQWRADMERQAQDNTELREKMDALNAKVAELQAQNAPKTDKLPDDIDPSLVVAPETAMLATAHSGTNWWVWGPLIAIMSIGGFLALCVWVSRNRQRLA